MKLSAVFTQGEKYVIGRCPELGVTTQGRTREEAKKNLKEAVELHLDAMVEYMIEKGTVKVEKGRIVSSA